MSTNQLLISMLRACIYYIENKKYDDAIAILKKVLQIHPKNIDGLHLIAVAFKEKKSFQNAREYFKKLLVLEKGNAKMWRNYGLLLCDMHEYKSAIHSYNEAIKLDPLYEDAWYDRGVALMRLNKLSEAIDSFESCLRFGKKDNEIQVNIGYCHSGLRQYDDAGRIFKKASDSDNSYPYLLGTIIFHKLLIADYSYSDEDVSVIIKNIENEKKAIIPLQAFSVVDDAELHLKVAKIWVQSEISVPNRVKEFKIKGKGRIKIGYFSSDFKEHPVAYLIAGLLELHDRSEFEIFAFSLQPSVQGDPIRNRLVEAVDRFIHLDGKSDEEISNIVQGFEIDIAIDLNGHTENNRLALFATRMAPIQVSYLGFPGTTGVDFIDYIIADGVVIPDEHKKFFTEKILYLPGCFMGDDDKRMRSKRIFTKKECGLPDVGIVFCCFNNSYKFNKKIIESWVRILKAVDKSVMWIAENNENFRKNLIEEFNKLGIDSSRIIFAEKMRLIGDHLARLSLADLFLDTYPYSAHSTAIDSLKSDVPVLTILGKSFPSRVAASLVNALGLTELIAKNFTEYELAAIDFGLNPRKLKTIKERLILGKKNNASFNTINYTKQLELGFKSIYSRYQSGLGVDDVFIENLH